MNRRLLVAVIFISCLTASFIGGMTVGADEPVEVKLTNLLRTELEITEGIEVIVSRIEIPAGTTLPTHYHLVRNSSICWKARVRRG